MHRLLLLTLFCGLGTSSLNGAVVGALNGTGVIDLVDMTTNTDVSSGNLPFSSDSLAVDSIGNFYSAAPNGTIFHLTSVVPVPVGFTSYQQIGDLDHATGGLWGYDNATTDLFFFDLGSTSVTYSAPLAALSAHTITGVAYQISSGSVFLSGYQNSNPDELFRVDFTPTPSVSLIGTMTHSDSFSYISDIEFDANGTLHAMTWFHRHFYTVDTSTAALGLLSVGPHRDATALAIQDIPEGSQIGAVLSLVFAGCGLGWARCRSSQETPVVST